MAIALIPSNSDQIIKVRVKGDDGNYIDMTTVSVIAAVYQKKESVLQKWSDSDIQRVSPLGTIEFYLDRANLKTIAGKRMFLELVVILTNSDFKNNEQRLVATDIPLADVVLSVL